MADKPDKPFGPDFLRAHSEAQVRSICRTHCDDPERSRAFAALVRSGSIRIRLGPDSDAERHALRLLGVGDELIGWRPPSPPASFRHLRPPFLRGFLPGQLAAVHRDLARRPDKAVEFQRAVQDGAVRLAPHPRLTPWHIRLLARLGVRVSPAAAIQALLDC